MKAMNKEVQVRKNARTLGILLCESSHTYSFRFRSLYSLGDIPASFWRVEEK